MNKEIIDLVISISNHINKNINTIYQSFKKSNDFRNDMLKIFKENYHQKEEWTRLQNYISLDEVFSLGEKKAGGFGSAASICDYIFEKSIEIEQGYIHINYSYTINLLDRLKETLKSNVLEYKVIARMIGMNLDCDEINLTKDIKLIRLNDKNLKFMNWALSNVFDIANCDFLQNNRTEIRFTFKLPVNINEEGYMFKSSLASVDIIKQITKNVCIALCTYTKENIEVGPIIIETDLIPRITTNIDSNKNYNNKITTIKSDEFNNIIQIYNSMSK